MKVIVYGPGCSRCNQTAQIVKETLEAEGVVFTLDKVSDFAEIAKAGVMATPGVAVDGKVVSTGKIPSVAEIKHWIGK